MKIRYFKSSKALRKKKAIAKAEAKREHKERIAKWHKNFAWRPMKVDTPDDDDEHLTIAWFETIMQKGRMSRNDRGQGIIIWTRFPEKEYFKKKLDGTLPPEEKFPNFEEMTHDSLDTNVSFTRAQHSFKKGGPPTPSYRKLGGPQTGLFTTKRDPDTGALTRINLKKEEEE